MAEQTAINVVGVQTKANAEEITLNKELSKIADELASDISELIKSRVWRANVSKEEMAETNVLMLNISKSIEKLRRLAE